MRKRYLYILNIILYWFILIIKWIYRKIYRNILIKICFQTFLLFTFTFAFTAYRFFEEWIPRFEQLRIICDNFIIYSFNIYLFLFRCLNLLFEHSWSCSSQLVNDLFLLIFVDKICINSIYFFGTILILIYFQNILFLIFYTDQIHGLFLWF